jgi:histidinol dehydrogenase
MWYCLREHFMKINKNPGEYSGIVHRRSRQTITSPNYDRQAPRRNPRNQPKDDGVIPGKVMAAAVPIFDDVLDPIKGLDELINFTQKFERNPITRDALKVSKKELEQARKSVSRDDLQAIKLAFARIKNYHQKQKPKGFVFDDQKGTRIEERVVPLTRVGLCIPGGQFPLASTVLMTAIPARLAGVKQIVMINPWPNGKMNPHVIAAAEIAGVDEIYKVGGVQGVAALAGGLLGEPADKIVGPGSVWVTAGKAIAFSRGMCGIDSLAGPSEVVIAADESALAHSEWIAWDLLSQAEHGDYSLAYVVTTSEGLLDKVAETIKKIINDRPGDEWIKNADQKIHGGLVADANEMARAVNQIAPEHLEIMVKDPQKFVKKITNAASIFIGPYSPVPAGDYMAGGNHVLPTGGTARFSSPLSVHDFVKRQSITTLSRDGLAAIAGPTARFAEFEGLTAHALAVTSRISSGPANHRKTQSRKDPKNTKPKPKKSAGGKAGK